MFDRGSSVEGAAGHVAHAAFQTASPEEGLRLLQAFRAITSPLARARILSLVVAEARRAGANDAT